MFKQTAQAAAGAGADYDCVYHSARLTYGATVVDDPPIRAAGAP